MEERLKLETEHLTKSWMRHCRNTLRNYLVRDVEDPRINVQSILTRHFLIKQLFGGRFDDLMEHELRFSLVMNWFVHLLKRSVHAWQLHAVLDALLTGEGEAEGLKIPSYVSETFATLRLPNYICGLLTWSPVETIEVPIQPHLLSTFERIWFEVLAGEHPRHICVLEPACGSANDYRFIVAFGIGQLLDYIGFDLCKKNIHNAKQMFPAANFKVGNALEIDAEDKAFDCCYVHDLFEHLSIGALEVAIAEICRVTRDAICVGFFNLHEGDRHVVKAVGEYHWNKLSVTETKAAFERYGFVVHVIHVDTFLRSDFNCSDTHNKGAYTFIIRRSVCSDAERR